MENKKYNILITITVILGILVLFLGGFIIYNKFFNQKEDASISENNSNINNNEDDSNINSANNSNTETEKYTTLDGRYEVVVSTYEGLRSDDGELFETCTFNENGLFYYHSSTFAEYGYYGNYNISGNKIILNYLFGHGGGWPSLYTAPEKSIEITLVDSNTIMFDDGTIYKKAGKGEDIESKIFENYEEITKCQN